MSDNVESITIEILRSIAKLDERLETGLRKDRRNSAGMLVMMRATAGDFDARVSEVEERIARLEARA